MAVAGKHGISENTPKNIQFGAGTIHKGLKYSDQGWNKEESIVGTTSGGSTLTITPEITTMEVDGAMVRVKGRDVKTGETATMEINFIELSKEIVKAATLGVDGTSEDATHYDMLESKSAIAAGDYWENVAFSGQTLEGKDIIVILDNAICTSGLSLNPQNKAGTVATMTFECAAEMTGDLDKLPWRIYYPKSA